MANVQLFKPMDIPYEHFEVNGVPMSLLTGKKNLLNISSAFENMLTLQLQKIKLVCISKGRGTDLSRLNCATVG